MSVFLLVAVLLLLNHRTNLSTAWDDKDFFTYCAPLKCSKHGPEVRFPFWLDSSNASSSSCGLPCMKLACSGQDTVLLHPVLGPYKVTAIDYRRAILTIISLVDLSPCLLPKLISTSIPGSTISSDNYVVHQDLNRTYLWEDAALIHCPREFTPTNAHAANFITGPISCLSNKTHFSYLINADQSISVLPLDCKVVLNGVIPIPSTASSYDPFTQEPIKVSTFRERAESVLHSTETMVSWKSPMDWADEINDVICYNCTRCELQGRRCAFSSQMNQTFCMHHATSSVATLVLLLMVATALYISLGSRSNEEVHLKVEEFLKTYGISKPTRYTFSEVKKIARRFKVKLGQGGFGSVYKGELKNGVPVAVKMLENSKAEGEEFINEVATIGRIHHANIVRLLGFCAEGTRRALIYEFMPNESLEKYIFSHDCNVSKEPLVPNKMLDIALGIARGMEYLHQGCNQRILHFDIKPHNILLDYSFNPKISDFGLAKLCERDQSIVALTAARGTMGYIAPELYSRNFGAISYKSDVYSFGMLMLEMISRRRNSDPNVENQNEVYLPELIYKWVITGEDLAPNMDMTQQEKEMVRQMAIVALWCIQWNPKNRPSMTKVVNMLTGGLQNLRVPPKPFVSSDSPSEP
uniref:Protein kinase domain-containing protein n=1 Tax=Oryza punctata TaxID=4537 RepID=A0A0E0JJN0_ORYPU